MKTASLDPVLDCVADCLTPEVAERLLNVRLTSAVESRLQVFAERANEGTLAPLERAEYERLVDSVDLLAILKATAREALSRHS